jgi:hypothetical protein
VQQHEAGTLALELERAGLEAIDAETVFEEWLQLVRIVT